MTSFSIIIVNWNGLRYLREFLPSVDESRYSNFEIILADNASTDGSADWVSQNYPAVKILKLDQNYGYCGGNNRGAEAAKNDVLVFLNNDARVDSEWLTHADACFKSDPGIAALQPKIRSHTNPDYFEYAGAAGGFLDKYGYPFCRGRIFEHTERDEGQYNQAGPIFWASGAALFIKRSVFNNLGGFEESFEFHMEEIDLCWRILRSGNKVWYCPQSVVYHLGGGSLPSDSPRKVYYNFRNNLLMLVRNHPRERFWHMLLSRFLLDDLAAGNFLLRGKFRNAFAISRAYLSFLRMVIAARRFRRESGNYLPHAVAPAPVSIVKEYYLKKVQTFDRLQM